jgi:hypothetical protein
MQKFTILTQDPLTGNFTIDGILAPNKVHTFLNGRYDNMNSSKWVNKSMKQMNAAPIKKEAQKQVSIITLDLRKGSMIMQGIDFRKSYKVSVNNNQLIVK